MNIAGLNLQNQWVLPELQRVNPGFLVIYENDSPGIVELRAALPNTHFCLRLFNDFEETVKLAERGERLARAYLRPGDCLVWANETNHELPQLSVERTIELHRAFMDEWRRRGWPAALCSPALSPGAPNADLAPYRDVLMACDYIGVHAYDGAEQHFDQVGFYWPNHRVLLTEFGTDRGDRAAYCHSLLFRASRRPNVVGACWFLWDSPEEQWRDWRAKGTPVEQALIDFNQAPDSGASSLPPEEPMPEPLPVPAFENDLQTFGRWYAEAFNNWQYGAVPESDPRVMHSFVDFVIAIGKDPTDLTALGAPSWAAPPQPTPEPPVTPPDAIPAPEVLDSSNVDIGAQIAATSERYGLVPWSLHACLIAESGMNPRAERWGNRSDEGRALTGRLDADPGDEAAMGDLMNLITGLEVTGYGADISFGYSQLIVGTAAGYGIGNGSNDLANVLDVRAQLFDRARSIDLGARHMAMCGRRVNDELGIGIDGDPVEFIINVLACYNSGKPRKPNDRYWIDYAANVTSYSRAIAQAFPIWA